MDEDQKVEASVWRLGQKGIILTNHSEEFAARLAESKDGAIYFFAELVTDAAE